MKMKKMTKISALAMAVIMGMSLGSCGTTKTGTGGGTKEVAKTICKTKETQQPKKNVTEEEKQAFASGVNGFSYELFEKMADGENLVISPYSVAMAMSMVDVGAGGETKEALEKVLGINDLDSWNNSVNWYINRDFGENTKVLNANSLWMEKDIALSERAEEDFLQVLIDYYNACVERRDLHTDDTRNAINQWAAEHTENMIPEMYNENIKEDVQTILMNAIYFEGKWETAFDQEDTYEQEFVGKNKNVKVDMMHQYEESYRYAECGELCAIELPYKDDTVVMDIIKRTPSDCGTGRLTTLEYWNQLTKKEKQELFETISTSGYETFSKITIPKFEMEWGKELNDALKQMGITSAFGENADFSKFSSDLCINSVFQKAKIIVDEAGTKAAAVTAVEMKECAMVDERKEFIVDEPFLFVIRDVETGVILFMGDVEQLS